MRHLALYPYNGGKKQFFCVTCTTKPQFPLLIKSKNFAQKSSGGSRTEYFGGPKVGVVSSMRKWPDF